MQKKASHTLIFRLTGESTKNLFLSFLSQNATRPSPQYVEESLSMYYLFVIEDFSHKSFQREHCIALYLSILICHLSIQYHVKVVLFHPHSFFLSLLLFITMPILCFNKENKSDCSLNIFCSKQSANSVFINPHHGKSINIFSFNNFPEKFLFVTQTIRGNRTIINLCQMTI